MTGHPLRCNIVATANIIESSILPTRMWYFHYKIRSFSPSLKCSFYMIACQIPTSSGIHVHSYLCQILTQKLSWHIWEFLYSEYSLQHSSESKHESTCTQCQGSSSTTHRKKGIPRNEALGKLKLLFNSVLLWEYYKCSMNCKMSLLGKKKGRRMFFAIV